MRHKFVLGAATALALVFQHAQAQSAAPRPDAHAAPFAAAIETLARKLEADYVTPRIGADYAAKLRSRLASGAYDQLTDAAGIAAQLTADLRQVNFDGHLRVTAGGAPPPHITRRDGPPDGPQVRGPDAPGDPRAAPAIADARWIEDGVAYIAFNAFPGTPDSVAAVDTFMKTHATARVLIIDARNHHGGGPAEMNAMLPYLFAKPTLLVDMDMSQAVAARHGPPGSDDPNMVVVKAPPGVLRREHHVTPHPTEHRLFGARVYYLTSGHTASAAEHLALALKRTHRATLVGEPTAGGNHFGGIEPLGEGLSAFIPVGRTFDPDTGKDWEGVGIAPDVAVPADRALEEALKLARSPA